MKRRIGVKINWLGHSAFRIESPGGKVILIDPWLDNPKAPAGAMNLERVDLLLVTHGHSDHLGNTVELAQKYEPTVVCNFEIQGYLNSRGVKKVEGINKSGTVTVQGIAVTMVEAIHSSSINDNGKVLDGGEAAGFVVRFENGFTLYHTGDTGLFSDMRLISQLYKPQVVMLPIGGYYTMGPREAAKACELIRPQYIIPMHWGTFEIIGGSPAELRRYLPAALKKKVLDIMPGEFVY